MSLFALGVRKIKKTHSNLVSHIRKFHEDVFNFLCKECDRGFLTRLGWNNHKKSHKMKEEEYLSCDKPGCKSKFTTKDSKKGHMRKFHGNFKKDCEFGCGKTFTTKTNYQQHVKSCSKNPNRKEFICDICGKGGYYLLSRMQEHKRDIHKWRKLRSRPFDVRRPTRSVSSCTRPLPHPSCGTVFVLTLMY